MKLLFLCALATAVDGYPEEGQKEWFLFKIQYGKNYNSTEEYIRRKIFFDNLQFIREHNVKFGKGEVTFSVGINQFADLTSQEFFNKTNCVKRPPDLPPVKKVHSDDAHMDFLDWRLKGAVTPVKDQGDCRSCWAFSAVGSMEGKYFIDNKRLISLSEQNVIDCITKHGCRAQSVNVAYDYLKIGVNSEDHYPYTGKEGKCKFNPLHNVAPIREYRVSDVGDEEELKKNVFFSGPASVVIRKGPDLQFYKAGKGGEVYQ